MGDMKNPGRGVPLSRAEDSDPFAELADMFEAELAMDTHASRAPAVRPVSDHERYVQASASTRSRVESAGRHAPLAPHDRDFDAAFEAALGDEFPAATSTRRPERQAAAPSKADSADAYQSWIVPRGSRPAAADPTRPAAATTATVTHGRSGYTGGRSLGADLETAIHGLSAPANPRDVIVVETQSFAPERVVDDYRHEPAQPELDEFDELIASELAVMKEPVHGGAQAYPGYYQQDDAAAHGQGAGDAAQYEDDGYYGDDAAPAPIARSSRRRTAVTVGGGVLSLALIGVVGLFVWNGKSADAGLQASNEPLLIKADNEPFKMVPKDPGGRTVPNQNKAVYNRVNGEAGASTTQQALLTDAEEPIDLPVEEEPAAYQDLPGVDPIGAQSAEVDPSQERIEVAAADGAAESPVPVLQPRKVRTMVVRPDGTIAPAEAAPAAPAPAVAAIPAAPPPPVRTVEAAPAPEAAAPVEPAAGSVQQVADVTPAPRQQDEAADPMQVAAIAPKPAPVAATSAAGGYYVQISSQPSEAAAQQSMRSLGAKFSGVISGRAVGIQPAEIPGKGTFYRVRVAAASKDDASDICGQLKAAGGNCFVAR